jgi:hypothetical protein
MIQSYTLSGVPGFLLPDFSGDVLNLFSNVSSPEPLASKRQLADEHLILRHNLSSNLTQK